MKTCLFLLLFLTTNSLIFGQYEESPIETLLFEEAEKAYSKKDYVSTIKKLDRYDEEVGATISKSLYLRILAQDKLIENSTLYEDEENFQLLKNLRFYTSTYLDKLSSQGLDYKYKEVFKINERINELYPQTIEEYRIKKNLIDIEKEKEKAEKEALFLKQKKSFKLFSVYLGFTNSTNDVSKSNVSYNEWLFPGGQSPYDLGMQRGKIGISKGFNMGFNGAFGIDKISEKIKLEPLSFGLVWDIKHTFLFHNYKNVSGVSDINDGYFRQARTRPFSIFSCGIGPDIMFQFSRFSFDTYLRADFNLISGGRYKAITENPYNPADDFYVINRIKGVAMKLSPTFGFRIQTNYVAVGLEIRTGINKNINYWDYYDKFSFLDKSVAKQKLSSRAISFNNISLNLAYLF